MKSSAKSSNDGETQKHNLFWKLQPCKNWALFIFIYCLDIRHNVICITSTSIAKSCNYKKIITGYLVSCTFRQDIPLQFLINKGIFYFLDYFFSTSIILNFGLGLKEQLSQRCLCSKYNYKKIITGESIKFVRISVASDRFLQPPNLLLLPCSSHFHRETKQNINSYKYFMDNNFRLESLPTYDLVLRRFIESMYVNIDFTRQFSCDYSIMILKLLQFSFILVYIPEPNNYARAIPDHAHQEKHQICFRHKKLSDMPINDLTFLVTM